MASLFLKTQDDSQRDKTPLVLSDVTKEELSKRRIQVYDYLL